MDDTEFLAINAKAIKSLPKVAVLDTQGKQLGQVSNSATSIGVCKRFGAASAQFSNRFGKYAWIIWR
jgi:hypothetical protein